MSSRLLLLALLVDGLCGLAAPTILPHVLPTADDRFTRIAGTCVELTLEDGPLQGGHAVDDGLCESGWPSF